MQLSKEKVKRNTWYSDMVVREQYEKLERYEQDKHKKHRHIEGVCRSCYYFRSGFAGQAFTKFACKNCNKEEYHPNTNVPKYCKECSLEHHACVRCGGEIDPYEEVIAFWEEDKSAYTIRISNGALYVKKVSGEFDNTQKKVFKDISDAEENGKYRHYKNKQYNVLGVIDAEGIGKAILYQAAYDKKLWIREYTAFFENIIVEGVEKPRFKKIISKKENI